MDKEEIKTRIDFNNVQELETELLKGIPESIVKRDYLVDYEGNAIIALSQLDVKLIERILDLEARIKKLEGK